jgi:hypothetical protein
MITTCQSRRATRINSWSNMLMTYTMNLSQTPHYLLMTLHLVDAFDDPVVSDTWLNHDLLKIETWAHRWLVDFNPTKTMYMTFTSKQNLPRKQI